MTVIDSYEIAYSLMKSNLPFVSHESNELQTERERMVINARQVSENAIDLCIYISKGDIAELKLIKDLLNSIDWFETDLI